MKTFTIDTDNNISASATPEEAAATTTTPFDAFASEKELASLIAKWPADRLIAIWNSPPGVTPVKKFKNAKVAAGKIWERIQKLGEAAKPKAEPKAKAGARVAKGAPPKAKATKETTPANKTPKAVDAASVPPTSRRARGRNACDNRVDSRDHHCGKGPQSPEGREARQNGIRAPRGQQDRPGRRDAPAQGRRHAGGDHDPDELAETHGPRVHGWRDEEGRPHRRVLQIREGGANLPHQ